MSRWEPRGLVGSQRSAIAQPGKANPLWTGWVSEPSAFAAVVALVAFQRLAIPVGSFQLSFSLVVLLGVLALWLATGRAMVHPVRLALWLAVMALVCLSSMIANARGHPVSVGSVLFLVLVYAMFTVVRKGPERFMGLLRSYQLVMLAAAAVGIIQFGAQFYGWRYQDLLAAALPDNLLHRGFNTNIPVQAGAALYKSNAVVFLEPSFFSKFAGIAVLVEILLIRRKVGAVFWRIPVFLAGMLVSFSGTGLIAMAAGLLLFVPEFKRITPVKLMGASFLVLVLLGGFIASGFGGILFSRVAELQDPDESGYIRFVAPYRALPALVGANVVSGQGAGAADVFEDENRAYASTYVKALYEYGLLATLAFLAFTLHLFFHRPHSWPLAVALFLVYAILTGALLQTHTVILCYLLGMLFVAQPAAGPDPGRHVDGVPS